MTVSNWAKANMALGAACLAFAAATHNNSEIPDTAPVGVLGALALAGGATALRRRNDTIITKSTQTTPPPTQG